MSKLDEILQLFQLSTKPLEQSYVTLQENIQKFEDRFKTLGEFVSYAARKENLAVHSRVLNQFRQRWDAAKQAEEDRILQLCSRVVETMRSAITLAAESIRSDFTDRFQYIFETIEIQEKQVRARALLEEVTPERQMKIEDVTALPTKHKFKGYSDLFSPAETTVECLDVNQHLLVLGGWDGCVSTYSRKNNDYQFEDIQPIAEVPIKQIRLYERMVFIRDQQNRLSIYFFKHHELEPYKTFQVGNDFVFVSKRVLDRHFGILTVRDGGLRVIDVKSEQEQTVLQSDLLKSNNVVVVNYRNKVLISSHRSLIIFDNASRTIDKELPHCFHHDIEDIKPHNTRYLVSYSHRTVYYDELKGDSVNHLFSLNLEMQISLLRVEAGAMLLIADGHIVQLMASKRVIRLSQGELFEFGATDMKTSLDRLHITGRDNEKQVRVFNLAIETE